MAPFLIASNDQKTVGYGTKRYKLVIQVSDCAPAKWNLALNNAKNVLGMLKFDAPPARASAKA